MNTLDEQIALIQAHMVQRAIQCRTTDAVNDKDLVWIPITKDHRFNFQNYEYRLAPVSDECWLIYDAEKAMYCSAPLLTAPTATNRAIQLNAEANAVNRYIPVRMMPMEV